MQSAWTISSRSSLEKGARARRKRDGGERRDGKERKEKEGGTRGERREGAGGEGKGVKRRPTSNVRHHFFLLYSSQVREEGERRREFFFDSQSYTPAEITLRERSRAWNREGNR